MAPQEKPMPTENALESRWPDILNINLVPAVARLTLPERRNVTARTTLLRRIRSEFEEMPGLSLTLAQAAKLFGVPPEVCSRILAQFAEEGLLSLTINRRYTLRIQRP
jgi:DNA-binding IclR family transcriptional regulator